MRELLIMAEAAWDAMAQLLAMTANVNRDTKKRHSPYHPADFNPFSLAVQRRSGIRITADNIRVLKCLVTRQVDRRA